MLSEMLRRPLAIVKAARLSAPKAGAQASDRLRCQPPPGTRVDLWKTTRLASPLFATRIEVERERIGRCTRAARPVGMPKRMKQTGNSSARSSAGRQSLRSMVL